MATAAQNYQMLEEALARNFANPINNYIAANTALGLQRVQQSKEQARALADRQEARAFQIEQQARALENQLTLQERAAQNQRDMQALSLTAAKDQRGYEFLLRQADAARQDPLMAGFDPVATPEVVVAEYQRRRGPEFSNPYYAQRVGETDLRLQNGIAQIKALTSGASDDAKIRAIKATASDPTVQQTLLDNGVSGEDISKLAATGDATLFKRIQDIAVKNAGGIFGRKGPSGKTLLELQNAYYANLGEASGASKDNPAFFPVLADIQAAAKQRTDYLGRITDKKLLTDLAGLKPAPSVDFSKTSIPKDPAVVSPSLSLPDYIRGIQAAPVAVPQVAPAPAFNMDAALQSFGLPPQQAQRGPATLASVGAYTPSAPVPPPIFAAPPVQVMPFNAPGNPIMAAPPQVMPYNAPGNPFVGF